MSRPFLRAPVVTPLREQVVDILRSAITDNLFEPGGRLRERELCEMLGVSRSTIREGLRQLEAEGLIKITPNKGPMVADLSDEEARNIYAIRARLQGMAAEIAAGNRSDELISELEASFKEMEEAKRDGDPHKLLIARTDFYNFIFDASGNPYLALLLRQMRARVTLIRVHNGLYEERAEETLLGASQVLSAIKAGDPEAAGKAAEEHIFRASELVFKARSQI